MNTTNIFKNAISNREIELNNKLTELGKVNIPNEPLYKLNFNTNELLEDKVEDLISKLPKGSQNNVDYIYLFKASNTNDIEVLRKAFESARESQKKLSKKDLCRINKNNKTEYFYVGRSKTIKTRIKQHLSDKLQGTYALHMARWCRDLDTSVTVFIFKFENNSDMVIQELEDGLWNELKPCFGKKGNK